MNAIKILSLVSGAITVTSTLLSSWLQDRKIEDAVKVQVEKSLNNK